MLSFTGRDSISTASFLESYKTSRDHSYVNERLAIQIQQYGHKAIPKQSLIAYIRHRGVSCPKVINFLLDKYPSKETII